MGTTRARAALPVSQTDPLANLPDAAPAPLGRSSSSPDAAAAAETKTAAAPRPERPASAAASSAALTLATLQRERRAQPPVVDADPEPSAEPPAAPRILRRRAARLSQFRWRQARIAEHLLYGSDSDSDHESRGHYRERSPRAGK